MENSIVEKIQKLLAKAEGTNNEAEAQAFFNGAQRLMAQHNIRLEDVNVTKEIKVEENIIIEDRANAARNQKLAYIIAKNFKCELIKYGSVLKFLGLDEDIKIATMTFNAIHTFIEKRRRQIYRDARKNGLETKGIREDYVTGFLKGLEEGFKKNVQEWGLVVVTPKEVVDHVAKMNCKATQIKQHSIKNSETFYKGYQDGKGFNREIE